MASGGSVKLRACELWKGNFRNAIVCFEIWQLCVRKIEENYRGLANTKHIIEPVKQSQTKTSSLATPQMNWEFVDGWGGLVHCRNPTKRKPQLSYPGACPYSCVALKSIHVASLAQQAQIHNCVTCRGINIKSQCVVQFTFISSRNCRIALKHCGLFGILCRIAYFLATSPNWLMETQVSKIWPWRQNWKQRPIHVGKWSWWKRLCLC